MKIKLLATTALALSGLVGTMNAQAIGDLVLGFQASSGTGSATNLEVDLGSISAFTSLGAGTYNVGNFGTDLSSIYGASGAWASDASLKYGVIGASNGDGDIGSNLAVISPNTLWATSNGNPGTAYVASSTAAQSTPGGKIQGIYGFTSASGSFAAPDTVLSDIGSQTNQIGTTLIGISTSNSENGAWTKVEASNTFGISGASSKLFTSANIGTGTGISSLYQIQPTDGNVNPPGNVVDLGFFTLNNTGELTFTVIPEPSTYAAILGAISIGFVMLRRRKQMLA